MPKEARISGSIESIIFQNPENGYTVFSVIPENDTDGLKEVVCIAFMADASEGERVELSGSFVMHPTYGEQFSVREYEKKTPNSLTGIEKYLASGVIKGIGEKLAKKIVAKFKNETLHVIENYPERLAEIKGIPLSKAVVIGEIFKEQTEQRNIMIALQGLGISPVYSKKIYEKYKADSLTVIKNNPYILADDIFGIGFKIADDIAYKIGFSKNDPFRINSGIKYALSQASQNGHSCMPRALFLEQAAELLGASAELLENSLVTLQMDRSICVDKIENEVFIYLNSFFYGESFTAKKLIELSDYAPKLELDIKTEIAAVEAETGITLAGQQRAAVTEAAESGVLVITGGPGTGKTTIINTIIRLFKKEGLEVELAAPTGRAAKRITETTGFDAKTIHRLLGVKFSDDSGKQVFERNGESPLECDALVVDESSMIDILLMYNLLKAVPHGTRLIFVGDADQLPSVGPGNVLRDIISSGVIKTVKLTEIFRQNRESAIILNAHRINNGEYPKVNDKENDFFLVKRSNADDVPPAVIELIKERLPNYLKISSKRDIQVLSPMRKGQLGIISLNTALQAALNPPGKDKNEKQRPGSVLREQDKVIQRKNNYNIEWRVFSNGKLKEEGMGVFNGDEGIIKKIDDTTETVTVIFDDSKEVRYDFSQLDELELSYAVTVHKSQGSEYHSIIMPVHSGPPMLMNRNILYTAVTRAKKMVVLVGTEDAVRRMVDNDNEVQRFSSLAFRLKKIKKTLSDGD